MPEGHTLHALARDLTVAFAGTTPSVTSPQGRFADGAALLDGRTVHRAWARGKLLFVVFDGDLTLHVHLGLIGTFTVQRFDPGMPVGPARGAVRVRLLARASSSGATHLAELRGPMACQVLTPEEVEALVARQGPDPLQPGADPDLAWERIRSSRRSIAELMMDQTVVAGVGNVYRCEVLFRHRVGPHHPGTRIKRHTWEAIWADLVHLMPIGVATGRIVTEVDDLAQVQAALLAGQAPVQQRMFAVYKRTGEACRRCGSRVRTQVVAGRNLYWCANCQRRT